MTAGLVTAALGGVAVGLVGLGGTPAGAATEPPAPPSSETTVPASSEPPAAEAAASSTTPTTDPGAPVGARADLRDDQCAVGAGPWWAQGGAWTLTGTLANPDEAEATYTVTVYVAAIEGGTVDGEATIETVVPGGAEVAIDTPPVATASTSELQCVLNVTKVTSG